MGEVSEVGLGRRDRNALRKQERIFEAASELFAERGFGAVTTQEIAERADIGAGTLFRYAASKGELLLMIYNREFRAALDDGERLAESAAGPYAQIDALIAPTMERARRHPENAAAYQRELMFGPVGETYRNEGMALVLRLEQSIALRLTAAAVDHPSVDEAARAASLSVFAALHLAIARFTSGLHPDSDPCADMRVQARQIVLGFLTQTTHSDTAPAT
ncbi:TetR/AcrR family transcriptional regulator [Millisia brevis]|uniref:TetR/AcrR family transcriptional regulator n=1 Tax=Millisia brevis TaxID=264148 RepID=UPI0012EDE465|nr:TetR/AcrR family transcriptional regulator [Millisia brevis]